MDFKGFFVVFKAAAPQRPTSGGQWSCIYLAGAVEGLRAERTWLEMDADGRSGGALAPPPRASTEGDQSG